MFIVIERSGLYTTFCLFTRETHALKWNQLNAKWIMGPINAVGKVIGGILRDVLDAWHFNSA